VSTMVNPKLLGKLKKYGAFDINACFNCGNCTAVCPLSEGNDSFPRKMIRFAQIGDSKRMLSSKELWLCYYCGECSDTCPRQAEPGEFMAAARRFAIASYDMTGISRLLYSSKLFSTVFMIALSLFLGVLLLSGKGRMSEMAPDLFKFISYDLIHGLGQIIMVVAALAMIVGILRMVMSLYKTIPSLKAGNDNKSKRKGLLGKMVRASREVTIELADQSRFRECDITEKKAPWYRSKRFIHWLIMWGFLGLLAATSLDYALDILVGKIPGQPVPLWNPTRLLGTVSGIFVLYGTSMAIILRIIKPEKYFAHSFLSDWLFLWLLFLATVTGFVVELSVYMPKGATWIYVFFLVHVIVSMEVVILLPFTKFAHAVYRPTALFIHSLIKQSAKQIE